MISQSQKKQKGTVLILLVLSENCLRGNVPPGNALPSCPKGRWRESPCKQMQITSSQWDSNDCSLNFAPDFHYLMETFCEETFRLEMHCAIICETTMKRITLQADDTCHVVLSASCIKTQGNISYSVICQVQNQEVTRSTKLNFSIT